MFFFYFLTLLFWRKKGLSISMAMIVWKYCQFQ